jgi:hypothetical protein
MPVHPMNRVWALKEDREVIILADKLGFKFRSSAVRGEQLKEGASEAGAISRCKSGPGKA